MDLPKLTDARRVCRMMMVLDEIHNAKDSSEAFTMSEFEYQMCGGVKKAGKRYSLYRQLVYATRDVKAYIRRGTMPSSSAVRRAQTLFHFHDNKYDIQEINDASMVTKDCNRVARLLILLQKLRRTIKRNCTHQDVRHVCKSLTLSYDEYLLCGAKKVKKSMQSESFAFEDQLRYCISDLKHVAERGRLYAPSVIGKTQRSIALKNEYDQNEYIDSSEEEDVDCIDTANVHAHDYPENGEEDENDEESESDKEYENGENQDDASDGEEVN